MIPFRPFLLGLAGFCWTAAAAAQPLASLSPESALPGPDSPPAAAAPSGAILLPLPFDRPELDRAFWDVQIRRPPPEAAIAIDLSCQDPSAVRALTLHLRCGDVWLSAQQTLESAGRQTLRFLPADFSAENGSPDRCKIDLLRLSAWKGAPRPAEIVLHSIRAETLSVAILRGGPATAPGQSALAAQCADRARRLFEKAGIPAAILSDDFSRLDLRPYDLLVLPFNPALSDPQIDVLERFLRRKGRIAAFYASHPRLASLLGAEIRPFVSQSEDWNTVEFIPSSAPGLPLRMAHRTRNLLPVRANAPDSATVARWLTSDGMADRNLPAAVVSPRGFCFSHVPPLATPSAVQWLLASLAASDPAMRPALDAHIAETSRRDAEADALLAQSSPPPGEIRAVWSLPIPERLRENTMRDLAHAGVTAVFEHLGTAGFLHYRSETNLLRSPLGDSRSRHFMRRATEFADDNRLQLHAWLVCWSLDGIPPERYAPLQAQDRLMRDASGNVLPWLCPSHPANQSLLLDAALDLASRGVAGIHLDYVRYPARDGCYSSATRAAFEKSIRGPVQRWPADVLPGAPLADAYEQFRRDAITDFLALLRKTLRQKYPAVRLSAAVYPTPESAAQNGQDWPRWLREDLLDFASPMLYFSDPSRFADALDLALAASPSPSLLLPGIGATADESQLDSLSVALQIQAARQRQTAGHALFQLDSELRSRILRIP